MCGGLFHAIEWRSLKMFSAVNVLTLAKSEGLTRDCVNVYSGEHCCHKTTTSHTTVKHERPAKHICSKSRLNVLCLRVTWTKDKRVI